MFVYSIPIYNTSGPPFISFILSSASVSLAATVPSLKPHVQCTHVRSLIYCHNNQPLGESRASQRLCRELSPPPWTCADRVATALNRGEILLGLSMTPLRLLLQNAVAGFPVSCPRATKVRLLISSTAWRDRQRVLIVRVRSSHGFAPSYTFCNTLIDALGLKVFSAIDAIDRIVPIYNCTSSRNRRCKYTNTK